MDLSALEKNLEDALAQVISEEGQLQAAIDAVKSALPQQPPAVVDPAWLAVKAALEANGWSEAVPEPPAPVEPTA